MKAKKDPKKAPDKKGDDVGDDGEEGNTYEKSVNVSGDDLQKGLDKLDNFIEQGDSSTRKEQLLTKALEEDLEKSEKEELFGLMGGDEVAEEFVKSQADEVVEGFETNEELSKAYDVSDFLREQHTELNKSLSTLADNQTQSDSRQHEFNLLIAKSMSDNGKLVKAMSERLGVIENQPVRGPKSKMAPGQVLSKSFGGAPPEGETMTKSQVLDGLDNLMVKSMGAGRNGASESGEDIVNAVAKYEQLQEISPSLLNEVRANIS